MLVKKINESYSSIEAPKETLEKIAMFLRVEKPNAHFDRLIKIGVRDKYQYFTSYQNGKLIIYNGHRFLLKTFGIEQEDILFETNEYGKPKLKKQENIFFNFSHSGDWVVCAIGDKPLGVDVEQIKGKDLEIAKRFYTEYEYEDLLRQKEEKRPECFIKYWTLKESYTKAEGKGLSIPFTTFGFRFTQDDVALYIGEEPSKEYFLYVYKIDEGYEAAVCAHDPDVKEFNEITLEQIREFFHV